MLFVNNARIVLITAVNASPDIIYLITNVRIFVQADIIKIIWRINVKAVILLAHSALVPYQLIALNVKMENQFI